MRLYYAEGNFSPIRFFESKKLRDKYSIRENKKTFTRKQTVSIIGKRKIVEAKELLIEIYEGKW